MENNLPQATTDLGAPTLLTGIGVSANPEYFNFFNLAFEQQVAVTATIVGTVWGVINIGKFCYQVFKHIHAYLKPAKNPAL